MKSFDKISIIIFLLTISTFAQQKVRLGNERLVNEFFHLIEGKRVGVIANHTSLLSNGEHLVDYLFEFKKSKWSLLLVLNMVFVVKHLQAKKLKQQLMKKLNPSLFSLW